jgi:hypothetical protein
VAQYSDAWKRHCLPIFPDPPPLAQILRVRFRECKQKIGCAGALGECALAGFSLKEGPGG